MKAARYDRDVYRLCLAGYVGIEIQELLDLSEEALQAALNRLADDLAPTAASRSVDLLECLPFSDELFRREGVENPYRSQDEYWARVEKEAS